MANRILYICHFVYWLRVHRSCSLARWVMEYEGRAWTIGKGKRGARTGGVAATEGFEPSGRGRVRAANAEALSK
jgi:hypothetical protein